jgi:predicted transcriptional regulator
MTASISSLEQPDKVQRRKRIIRDTLLQDTMSAWDEFQATGLHVTAMEIDTWLASWGTDNELSIPVCHK